MSGRGRSGAALRLSVAVCVVTLGLQLGACRGRPSEETPSPDAGTTPSATGNSTSLELYFPNANDRLQRETREIVETDDATARVRLLVESLLAGPTTDGLFAPLPPAIELAAVQIGPDGVAYLDFDAPQGGEPPASGTRAELAAVFSIVDSVVLNVAEVRAVVLLWSGRQRFSFEGHVDTSTPLTANLDLVVGGS